MTSDEIQNKWIQAIKDCGQSLIDNAEEIAGRYDNQTSVCVSMRLSPGATVRISVETSYIPENKKGGAVRIPIGESISFR